MDNAPVIDTPVQVETPPPVVTDAPLPVSTETPQVITATPEPVVNSTESGVTTPGGGVKDREVAYVIHDKNVGDFAVIKSDNAWWTDREKVTTLINCFKQGYNVKQACLYVGISRGQWDYFNDIHPDFSVVKESCEEVAIMIAETGNFALLQEQDGTQIRWFLERRKRDKYGKDNNDSGGNTFNNFGTVNTAPIDPLSLDPKTLALIQAKRQQNGIEANNKE